MQHGTPAPPPPPGGVPRWQYLIVEVTTFDEQQTALLNRHGAAGWELVGMESRRRPGALGTAMSFVLVFKRPLG